jgi:hypothetical protein
MHHRAILVVLRWGLLSFLHRLTSSCDPLISLFQVAGITSMSHCTISFSELLDVELEF